MLTTICIDVYVILSLCFLKTLLESEMFPSSPRFAIPWNISISKGEKCYGCYLSILLELPEHLSLPHLINELLDSLVSGLLVRARSSRDQVGRLDLLVQAADFVGHVDRVGVWVILSAIGAGGIEGHPWGRARCRLHLHDEGGHREGGHKLFNVIELPGRWLGPIVHLGEVVVQVTRLAAQLLVAWDGAIARQDFHPTEH